MYMAYSWDCASGRNAREYVKSGNEWSLEEIRAEDEILAGRGEILGGRGGGPGRPGGRPLSGRGGGWAAPGRPPGEAEFPSRGPPWGGPR